MSIAVFLANDQSVTNCTVKNRASYLRFLYQMWTNPKETTDLFTFTNEILNRKLHFLWRVRFIMLSKLYWLVSSTTVLSNNSIVNTEPSFYFWNETTCFYQNVFIILYHLKILHATCLRRNPFQIQLFLLFLLLIMRFLEKKCINNSIL